MILQFFFFFQNSPHTKTTPPLLLTGPILRLHTILPNHSAKPKIFFLHFLRLTFHTTHYTALSVLRAPTMTIDDDDSGRGGSLDIFNLFFHKRFNGFSFSVGHNPTTHSRLVDEHYCTALLYTGKQKHYSLPSFRFVEFGVSLISTPNRVFVQCVPLTLSIESRLLRY